MPNIKFNYLYRDGGNYKKHISIVFANPTNIDLSDLERLIQSKLIFGEWFYAEEWKLPEIFTDIVYLRIDPTWHEFANVEYTDEAADESYFVEEFIQLIS